MTIRAMFGKGFPYYIVCVFYFEFVRFGWFGSVCVRGMCLKRSSAFKIYTHTRTHIHNTQQARVSKACVFVFASSSLQLLLLRHQMGKNYSHISRCLCVCVFSSNTWIRLEFLIVRILHVYKKWRQKHNITESKHGNRYRSWFGEHDANAHHLSRVFFNFSSTR